MATLLGIANNQKAAGGILLTLEVPATPMRDQAVEAGRYKSNLWHDKDYPKIQLLTIEGWLSGNERVNASPQLSPFGKAQGEAKPQKQTDLICTLHSVLTDRPTWNPCYAGAGSWLLAYRSAKCAFGQLRPERVNVVRGGAGAGRRSASCAIGQEPKMNQKLIFRILLGLAFGCCLVSAQPARDSTKTNPLNKEGGVTIEYIAHACFRLTSPSGKQILLDPYASRVWLGYDFPPGLHADAILISHPHYDHDGGEAMGRKVPWPQTTLVLRHPGTNQRKHADPWGKEFGQSNTVWLLEVGGLRIVHLGDNGPLGDDTIRQIGRVDVLMMPIDSQFHILKADEIAAIRRELSPSVLIPMHYRHDDLESVPGSPEALGGIEGWAKGKVNVRYLDTYTNRFSVDTLPRKPEVIIFKHSPLVRPAK